MQALGGTLELESTPGKGTIAVLTLPLQTARTQQQRDPKTNPKILSPDRARRHLQPDVDRADFPEVTIRVLLVDDHAIFRQGLRSLLECHADVEIVGEAADGKEALALVEQLRPAIVIMDINMPNMNGIQATATIKERYPLIKIIGLSVNSNSENKEAMRSAGAEFLLTKEAAVEQLYAGIQEIQHC
jgi:CheY-like chemotaxis protein